LVLGKLEAEWEAYFTFSIFIMGTRGGNIRKEFVVCIHCFIIYTVIFDACVAIKAVIS